MLGLKTPAANQPPDREVQSGKVEKSAPSAVWKRVPPKKLFQLGRYIACCIDEDSIQFAACRHLGRWQKLLDVRKTYIPSIPDRPEERVAFIESSIDEYLSEFGGRNPTISLVVGGSETAFRSFTMPGLSRKKLSSAIHFEVRKRIPFPIADSEYDYRVIGKLKDFEQSTQRISVLATTRQLLEQRIERFAKSGRSISHVYHSQDVVGQLLPQLADYRDDSNYALINIERHHTEIAYYEGSRLEFYHICDLGSSFLSNRSDPAMFELFSESLATEIQNSLDYYSGQFSAHFTNQVFVYGNLSYTDDLIDLLTNRFGFAFRRFPAEELEMVRGRSFAFESSLPVCLPVLASATCSVRLADLLPQERKSVRQTRKINRFGIAGIITLILSLMMLWTVHNAEINQLKDSLQETTRQVENFRISPAYDTYRIAKQQSAADQVYLNKTQAISSYLGPNLKGLSQLTPKSVRLYQLDFHSNREDRNLRIAGIIAQSTVPPEIILAEYIETLAQSALYDDVTLDRHVKRSVGSAFELDFQISAKGVI
jgi:Tfp pilus assembly PilM family ATPase